jgi:hypothetical protein
VVIGWAAIRFYTQEVIYTPDAKSVIQRAGAVQTLPEPAIQAWSSYLVATTESFNPQTIITLDKRVSPYVLPSYRAEIAKGYEEHIARMKRLVVTRSVSPGMTKILSTSDERIVVAVAYEQYDYTGEKKEERTATVASDLVLAMTLVQDLPTDENPLGLFVIERKRMTRQEWLASRPKDAFWDVKTTGKPAERK